MERLLFTLFIDWCWGQMRTLYISQKYTLLNHYRSNHKMLTMRNIFPPQNGTATIHRQQQQRTVAEHKFRKSPCSATLFFSTKYYDFVMALQIALGTAAEDEGLGKIIIF